MKTMTVVTGPMRSGTSCLTGLLERCGFDLGRNIRVVRAESEYNPKGHFETDLLFTINYRLLTEVPGREYDIFSIPAHDALAELACKRENYFQLFLNKFDGNLCKDPLLCVTLAFWEKRWPQLQNVVYCLRNPLDVAHSMTKRYQISIQQGLHTWQEYTSRLFSSDTRCKVFIFDFDLFARAPVSTMASLLDWLEKPMKENEIAGILEGFFSLEYIHAFVDKTGQQNIPAKIQKMYNRMHTFAGALEKTNLILDN
jgi:hypothetical protein